MNSEMTNRLLQLERATSSGRVDPRTLDDETTVLRDRWLNLCQLLDAGEDEPSSSLGSGWLTAGSLGSGGRTLVRSSPELNLPEECFVTPELAEGREVRAGWLSSDLVRTRPGFRGWLPAAACVVLLTIASGLVVFERGATRIGRSVPSSASASPRAHSTDSMSVSELAWDDEWESSLAQAAVSVRQIRSDSRPDAALMWLRGAVRELAQDVESSSL